MKTQRAWDEFYRRSPRSFSEAREEIEIIEKHKKEGKVLDIGCGIGGNALHLASHGFDVTGIDVSKVAIDMLIDQAQSRDLRLKGIVSSVLDYVITDFYDVVICTYVLKFLNKRDALNIVSKIKAATRENGINFIANNAFTPPYYPEQFSKECYFEERELLHLYDSWKVLHYDESPDLATRDGEPELQNFAVIIAQKLEDKVKQ